MSAGKFISSSLVALFLNKSLFSSPCVLDMRWNFFTYLYTALWTTQIKGWKFNLLSVIYMSVCLSGCLSVYLSLSIIYLFDCLSVRPSACVPTCVSLSVCLSICLSLSVYYLSLCLSVSLYLTVRLSVYLPICVSVCLFLSIIYLTLCLSVYVSTYLRIPIYCNEFAGYISRWNFIALQKSIHYS
jgi:hypothetical protein